MAARSAVCWVALKAGSKADCEGVSVSVSVSGEEMMANENV